MSTLPYDYQGSIASYWNRYSSRACAITFPYLLAIDLGPHHKAEWHVLGSHVKDLGYVRTTYLRKTIAQKADQACDQQDVCQDHEYEPELLSEICAIQFSASHLIEVESL